MLAKIDHFLQCIVNIDLQVTVLFTSSKRGYGSISICPVIHVILAYMSTVMHSTGQSYVFIRQILCSTSCKIANIACFSKCLLTCFTSCTFAFHPFNPRHLTSISCAISVSKDFIYAMSIQIAFGHVSCLKYGALVFY